MKGIDAPNLAEMYRLAAERYGDLPAFASRMGKDAFQPISYRDLYEAGLALGEALIELGVKARDHVALLADNCVEWNLIDYAALLIGAADVPRGTDITNSEIEYIVEHSDATFVFVENEALLKRALALMPKWGKVSHLGLMARGKTPPEGVHGLYELIARGKALRASGSRRVEERMAAIVPEDLFTIIYTSGTTGAPKGVQLTHANMAYEVRSLPFRLESDDRLLSILPVWHSYERVFQMVAISNGCCTYFTSVRRVGDDLKTVRPTMMASAPRLWENLYQKIMKSVESSHWIRRGLFRAAYFCSRMVNDSVYFYRGWRIDLHERGLGDRVGLGALSALKLLVFTPFYIALNAVVLEKLRQVVGGSFRGTVSGGGALQPHVDQFFNYIGIPVLEGYGLTETSPVIGVRTEKSRVIGTIGPVYAGASVRIVDLNTGEILYPDPKRRGEGRGLKGEIHVKGPQVMKGYYKNPEATARVLKDGWLNTGDIGIYTFNDCLKIVGRSKDTIVLLNGENIEPVPIEAKLCESALIDQCMVVGQDQKQLGVLVVPSLEGFKEAGIEAADLVELAAKPEALAAIHREVKRLVSSETGFKGFEHVHEARMLPVPFALGVELTNTFKIKRHIVYEKYAALVEEMYQD